MSDTDELAKLADLHQRGLLTDAEFAKAKAKVLGDAPDAAYTAASDPLNALHLSRRDRWVGGVCGGIGEVTGTPSWLWRLSFTLLALVHGCGIVLYLLMWIFLPSEDSWRYSRRQTR